MIFGDTVPSGKLPITFPANESDVVFPETELVNPYNETLFSLHRSPKLNAAFPFGHGLSFTQLAYDRPEVVTDSRCREVFCLAVSLRNAGNFPGREVVQVYFNFTQAYLTPSLLLRASWRTEVIQPGGVANTLFSFSKRELSLYHVGIGFVQQRSLNVHIGASSTGVRHVLLINLPSIEQEITDRTANSDPAENGFLSPPRATIRETIGGTSTTTQISGRIWPRKSIRMYLGFRSVCMVCYPQWTISLLGRSTLSMILQEPQAIAPLLSFSSIQDFMGLPAAS